MRYLIKLLLLLLVLVFTNSCEKTYDDGPRVTFKSPMKRILGTWELVSVEGTERLQPWIMQTISFGDDSIGSGKFECYAKIQGRICKPYPQLSYFYFGEERMQSGHGWWQFYSGEFIENCAITDTLKEFEGVRFSILSAPVDYCGYSCKILKLTSKTLTLKAGFCQDPLCENYPNSLIFYFKRAL